MTALIDTNVAIYLRDGDPEIIARVDSLAERPIVSIVTRVELEGGIAKAPPGIAARRRTVLDALLARLSILDFDDAAASAYAAIIAVTGYSRPRVLDRMIAATALAHGASLITINGQHFRDIPGLDLIEWDSPALT